MLDQINVLMEINAHGTQLSAHEANIYRAFGLFQHYSYNFEEAVLAVSPVSINSMLHLVTLN